MFRMVSALLACCLAAALAAVSVAAVPTSAEAGSRWAPAGRAGIHPGVQMFTKGAQCTGNFVFTDRRGRVYVGYAAHCAARGSSTDTNGCQSRTLRLGTPVRFAEGATVATNGVTRGRGRLAYSSWITMRKRGVRRAAPCLYNDFALVRVNRRHVRKVNPSVPVHGGPTGLNTTGVKRAARVWSYGQSSARPTTLLSPKTGFSLGQNARGWNHDVYTVTPGIPGDSGSGFLDARGRAFGTLSTVAIAPFPASNGVGDLRRELRFAQRYSGIPGLRLVRGTRPFRPVA